MVAVFCSIRSVAHWQPRTRMTPIVHGLAEFLGDGNVASTAGRKQRASLAGGPYMPTAVSQTAWT